MISEFYRKLAWYENYRIESLEDNNINIMTGQFDEKNSEDYEATSISDYHKKYRIIHIMKFDDMTGVKILDTDDCICTQWDKLDYKF